MALVGEDARGYLRRPKGRKQFLYVRIKLRAGISIEIPVMVGNVRRHLTTQSLRASRIQLRNDLLVEFGQVPVVGCVVIRDGKSIFPEAVPDGIPHVLGRIGQGPVKIE